MCNCIATANKQLRDTRHRLIVANVRVGDRRQPRVLLRTTATDAVPGRHGTPTVLATHCPFCGTKYEE